MLEKRDAEHRPYQVQCRLRCAMLAEENETSGVDWKGTAKILELAEELMDEVIDALDFTKRGKAQDEQAA